MSEEDLGTSLHTDGRAPPSTNRTSERDYVQAGEVLVCVVLAAAWDAGLLQDSRIASRRAEQEPGGS